MISILSKKRAIKSIFDVGCGCGANLYLFLKEGLQVGGLDYSLAQINIAKQLFNSEDVQELICGEAIELVTNIKYDAVIANSVFSYFESDEYAEKVLDKMLEKANIGIACMDIHDINKKNNFIEYRRKTVANYDERYRNLNKHFYYREFFYNWAKRNDLEIEFRNVNMEGYWNNEFVFDVYFYK